MTDLKIFVPRLCRCSSTGRGIFFFNSHFLVPPPAG